MALAFVAISSAATVAAGDISLSEPAGAQAGDLLVACIAYRSNAAFALPDGWSLVATQQSSGNTSTTTSSSIASGLMAYTLRGSGAPALTFTRTGGDVAIGRVSCYRGVDPHNPYDVGSASTLGANSATVTTASLTTAVSDELVVMACCLADNTTAGSQVASTDPGGVWPWRTLPSCPPGQWELWDIPRATRRDTSASSAPFALRKGGSSGPCWIHRRKVAEPFRT
jgi:hypothetical protein